MRSRSWIVVVIVSTVALASLPPAEAGVPCCSIVSIARSGMVTAKETATGKTFQFQANDQALAKTLRVGQKVYADFGTQQVAVAEGSPCCGIVSAAGGPTGTVQLPSARMPTIYGGEPCCSSVPCCSIVANTALKGRLGRMVVAYPGDAKNIEARMDVYKEGTSHTIAGGYGNQMIELLPGTYDVVINGKKVTGVAITSGHETQVKVGVLHVNVGKGTRVDIFDPATPQLMTGGYGEKSFGFPIGSVDVKIAGQTEKVTITEGHISEF